MTVAAPITVQLRLEAGAAPGSHVAWGVARWAHMYPSTDADTG